MTGIRKTIIRISILGALAAAAAMAQPTITTVANAASGIVAGLPNSGIAQGSIFLVIGSGLGPGMLTVAQSPFQSGSLSDTSVSVTVNGITEAGLMYYTSATQVAALLPSGTPAGIGNITVTYNNQTSQQVPITVVPNNLGIFTATENGQGTAIVTYPDYTLVSVSKAINCGLPDTACGAANPGDVLVLWATGLGPISPPGNDASGAGLGVAMPNIPLKLFLGGVQAIVSYQGRSGCCIGEDQIIFTVPNNVPTGCAVPLAVQIGNTSEISNYTVMPVAPVGSRTCTATNPALTSSIVQQLTNPVSPLAYGTIQLKRQPNFVQSVQQGYVDNLKGQFYRINVPISYQPFIASYADTPPPGTCMVFNSLSGPVAAPFALLAGLNAGPNIQVSGPNGMQIASGAGGQYSGTLSQNGSFLSPGNYTLTSAGGGGAGDIGPINAPLTIPIPPTLTGAATANNVPVTRANGFTVTWTGAAANSIVTIQGTNATDITNTNGAGFACYALGGAGSMTIPPSVLLALPAGPNGGWDFVPGILPVTFLASGLNIGYIGATYDTPIFTTLQ